MSNDTTLLIECDMWGQELRLVADGFWLVTKSLPDNTPITPRKVTAESAYSYIAAHICPLHAYHASLTRWGYDFPLATMHAIPTTRSISP